MARAPERPFPTGEDHGHERIRRVDRPQHLSDSTAAARPYRAGWSYLVESEKRRKWFARGAFDLRPGGRIDLIFKHSELSAEKDYREKYKTIEQGHSSHGEVLRCERPHVIAFTWGDDTESVFSEVTFELTPQNGKCC